jgi:hypothetical protein
MEEDVRSGVVLGPDGHEVMIKAGSATHIYMMHRCSICRKIVQSNVLPNDPIYNSCDQCRNYIDFLIGVIDEFETEKNS